MRLIAIVGADGMGKTTQAELLAQRLVESGHDVAQVQPLLVLFNPWGDDAASPMGKALSPRLRRAHADHTGAGRLSPARLLRALVGISYAVASYAFLRARFRRREILVCDRYFYQYFYDLLGSPAKGLSLTFPRPDDAFWLDGTPELVLLRTADENLEGDWHPYYESLMRYYEDIAGPLRFIRIDAEAPVAEVNDRIWGHLAPTVGVRKP